MPIRIATGDDRDHIGRLYLSAFPESERDIVAGLAVDLLVQETDPPTISLVAESDGTLVGHGAFSPLKIANDAQWQGYILAPLAVEPGHQGRGIGSQLLEVGRQRLSERGVHLLFVYGDPGYYGRFGFSAATATNFLPPYEMQYPFGWQAVVLNEYSMLTTPVNVTCVAALCAPELW